ncbi:MAG: hypothetical protein KIT09_27840 [Bryobacteraceae bacterium]|nr:hypothetical protein [Bryobacteraceae bacterium]
MDGHVKILGALQIALGCLGALIGLGFLMFFGGLAGVVGITAARQDPDAMVAIPILAAIGGFICVVLLVLSLPSIVAGVGLLKFRPWARILTIVLCAIGLLNVPIGTAIGVYGLWVLLSRDTEPLFRAYPRRVA